MKPGRTRFWSAGHWRDSRATGWGRQRPPAKAFIPATGLPPSRRRCRRRYPPAGTAIGLDDVAGATRLSPPPCPHHHLRRHWGSFPRCTGPEDGVGEARTARTGWRASVLRSALSAPGTTATGPSLMGINLRHIWRRCRELAQLFSVSGLASFSPFRRLGLDCRSVIFRGGFRQVSA